MTFEDRQRVRRLLDARVRARLPFHETCEECCDDFYPAQRSAGSQRFCSEECRDDAAARRNRERNLETARVRQQTWRDRQKVAA